VTRARFYAVFGARGRMLSALTVHAEIAEADAGQCEDHSFGAGSHSARECTSEEIHDAVCYDADECARDEDCGCAWAFLPVAVSARRGGAL